MYNNLIQKDEKKNKMNDPMCSIQSVLLNEEWPEHREQSHAYPTFDVSTSQLCVRGHHKTRV